MRRINNYLSRENLLTLVHAFITSRLDYCNSLLYAVPKDQIGSFSNDNGDGNENVTNLHIQWAKTIALHNSFARPARAFFIFVHFFAVVSKATT